LSSASASRTDAVSALPSIDQPSIFHCIGWYGSSPAFDQRFELFLESIDRAEQPDVRHLAFAESRDAWSRPGWEVVELARDARSVGDARPKPFLKDMLDEALARAEAHDWLLYSNSDLGFAADTYVRLGSLRASAVEFMRRDVEGEPRTLDELFANPWALYGIGLDGFALRASLYARTRDALPDFVIGEPHWDTAWSEILRRFVPVRRDTVSLFHPRHAQVWDIAKPTPAGRHNEKLFVAALLEGNVPNHRIGEEPDRTDTAVVVASFGADPLRAAANVEGLRRQLGQDLYADVYLVELLLEDEESPFPSDVLAEVRHLVLRGDDACRDLFQKEALQNIGWRAALAEGGYEHFLFVDADVYATELDWFSRVRERLRDDPGRAVQGFRIVADPVDERFYRSSVGATFVLDHQTDLHPNPGIAWGLHRSLLESGDGFNPLCIECGGDSAFVTEYLNTAAVTYDPWLLDIRWFREIERDLPVRAALDCVPVDLVHVNHGPSRDRNYQEVRYAIDGFPPLDQLVELGADGLLRWRDPACPERRLLRRRPEMRSQAEVERLFAEHGYARRSNPPVERALPRQKPVSTAAPPRPLPRPAAEPAEPTPGRLSIFDPRQVYRSEWPFSWSDNVERGGAGAYAPLAAGRDTPTLSLRRLSPERAVVVALAVLPTWETADLRELDSLELTVLAAGGEAPEVLVWLTSHSPDGADGESEHVRLQARGLRPGVGERFTIDLAELVGTTGFDLAHTRQVVVVGRDCELLELSRIAATAGSRVEAPARRWLPRRLAPRPPGLSPSAPGRVRIERGTVVTDRGEQLRGVPVWIYKYGSRAGLSDHVADPSYYEGLRALGINGVRLVCFDAWQRSNGYPHYRYESSGRDRRRFLAELDTAVDLASRAGLYVLVNYHDVGCLDLEHCQAFWQLVAGRYADLTNVFYELANEPVAWSAEDWDDAALDAQRALLATVRVAAPRTHVVHFSFPNTFDGRRTMSDVAAALDADWTNASLGFHCYRTDGTSAPIVTAREQFPVLCTEVDVPVAFGGDPNGVPMDGEPWPTQTLERLAISWFSWRANGPHELELFFRQGILAAARRDGYAWAAGDA
jgi:hypothetical protein